MDYIVSSTGICTHFVPEPKLIQEQFGFSSEIDITLVIGSRIHISSVSNPDVGMGSSSVPRPIGVLDQF